jgi:hypothetical protein
VEEYPRDVGIRVKGRLYPFYDTLLLAAPASGCFADYVMGPKEEIQVSWGTSSEANRPSPGAVVRPLARCWGSQAAAADWPRCCFMLLRQGNGSHVSAQLKARRSG